MGLGVGGGGGGGWGWGWWGGGGGGLGVWGWGDGGGWGGGEFIRDTISPQWIYLVLQKRLLYPLNHFHTTHCVLLKMRWLSTEIGLNVLNRQLLSDSAMPKHHVNCFATHDLPELFRFPCMPDSNHRCHEHIDSRLPVQQEKIISSKWHFRFSEGWSNMAAFDR